MGGGKTVTYKGNCKVHDDSETKDWFYPEFASFLRPDEDQARIFRDFLDSPARVVIEFTPDYKLSYDGDLMWARSPELIRSKDERASRTSKPKST